MSLTANQMRCLLAILALTRVDEEVASKSVAKLLGVIRPTVHKALDILMNKGLLEKEHYGSAHLTEQGLALAEQLEMRQERLILLFCRTFDLPMDESCIAATLLMSGLSEESPTRLERYSGAAPQKS